MSCSSGKTPELKAPGYLISSEEDGKSERWAEYLYNHLKKRSNNKDIVVLLKTPRQQVSEKQANYKRIHFELADDLKNSFCIDHSKERLHIRVQNKKTAVWMIYQLIESISTEDNRINGRDLNPSIITFGNECHDFDFEYRDPHYAPNLEEDMSPIYGNDNVETEWGIWGHNLSRVAEMAENENVYALVNNRRNKNQICFSSPELFSTTKSYIIDQFGYGKNEPQKFMLMPNDNNLVCMCPNCSEIGNTNKNASPAVVDFVNRISQEFPNHKFYLSAYSTTLQAPEFELTKNSGVFFSTIHLKKGIDLNPEQPATKKFIEGIEKWKFATKNIYLWDYSSNFDDYLTPHPNLYSLQQQLKFFKTINVKGIFLNASGYDYIPFDDLKTYIASALLMNSNSNIDELTQKFFKKKYPVSANLLSQYYLQLEKKYSTKNRAYNLYGSMRENMNTYFDAADFIAFYNQLFKIIPKTKDEERKALDKLSVALTYTRLQIAYTMGSREFGYAENINQKMQIKTAEIKNWLDVLKRHTEMGNLKSYKETDGSLEVYINEWEKLIAQNQYENLLMGSNVNVLSPKNDGYERTNLLTDGVSGFTQDYHQGWYINGQKIFKLSFPTEKIKAGTKMKLRFLVNERHRFHAPTKIDVLGDGKIIASYTPQSYVSMDNSSILSLNLSFKDYQNIELHLYNREDIKSTIACDEVQILK